MGQSVSLRDLVDDMPEGAGCAEMWEALSEYRESSNDNGSPWGHND